MPDRRLAAGEFTQTTGNLFDFQQSPTFTVGGAAIDPIDLGINLFGVMLWAGAKALHKAR